jgi:hypothetical protein
MFLLFVRVWPVLDVPLRFVAFVVAVLILCRYYGDWRWRWE